jgi:pyridoxamine 5'-phosphate oxidase family protein
MTDTSPKYRQGKPDVSPVAFEFNGTHFFIGSHSQDIFLSTRKYKNVRDGNKEVALIIDDLESVQPWKPRAMKINGTAEIVEHNGIFGTGKPSFSVKKLSKLH